MKRFQKIFSVFLLFTLVIQGSFGFTSPAEALFGVSIPTPSSIADQMEKRYNLDLGSLQDQAQTLNVAENKQLTPEVNIIFDPSDPRPGQRLTAKAFPLHFNGPQEQLYYTWYLRRAACDLDNNPSDTERGLCDEDGDGDITVEDWKITAMGELARNSFNNEDINYSTDTDNDGYQARFGGNSRVNVPNHCYFHDNESGEDYEIADAGDMDFGCADGKDPVCVVTDQVIQPGSIEPTDVSGGGSLTEGTGDINFSSSGGGGDTFEMSGDNTCFISGSPICKGNGTVACSNGTPACVDRDVQADCGSSLTTCSATSAVDANPTCRHLFPNAPSEESGDGSFGRDEERFWRTNPEDDSTAANGNKDEANIVGLGRIDFSWNYAAGDQVGVVVEGTSLLTTKHSDSSYKIMWAFSQNDCPISEAREVGSYTKTIKNYQVVFPTANIDLDRCLERNLVDPTQGGQATNLTLQMVTSPENPVNDETADRGGDTLTVQTLVDNGQKGSAGQLFDWRVEISNNQQFNNAIGRVADITDDLMEAGLLRQAQGTGLDTIEINLNMARTLQLAGRPLTDYLSGEQGFLRISSRVSENFSSGIVRKGRTDAIVAFTSTRNKIIAYKAEPVLVGNKMRVQLPGDDGIICQDARLDRAICRVLQNEVIGLTIEDTGLTNFQWSINNSPLQCAADTVSPSCGSTTQNEINFFPVSGGVGSSYTVSVTANDIESGKTVSLSRLFQVVDPTVAIISADPAAISPKFLGQYRDIRGEEGGCPDGFCSNYSKSVFEGQSGKVLKLKTLFIPSFLSKNSQLEWEVDGTIVTPTNPNELSVDATNTDPGQVVNITARAVTSQEDDTRRALIDTWGISQLDSPENRFEQSVQVEIVESTELGDDGLAGVQKYLAAFGTYLPETFLYTLRMILSGGLVLFVAAAAFVFLPEPNAVPYRINRREE